MTIIERMARAMCALQGFDPDGLARDHMMEKERVQAGNPPLRWEDWEEDARAALAAMRGDPGHDVTYAIVQPGQDRTAAVEAWDKMIEAAINEGEG